MRGRWVVPAAVILVASAVAFGAWGVARGRHHALYNAFLIPLVAQRVAGDARAPEDVVRRLHEFVYLNLRMPVNAPILPTVSRDVLLRGFAYCDQAVFVFIDLLEQRGISGRMTFLYRSDGVSLHTVSEVKLGDDWRVFDVLFGFVPTRPDGVGASVRDLVEQPKLLAASRVPVEWYRYAKVHSVRGPEGSHQGEPAWASIRPTLVRRVAELTPRWVADRLQDLYLWLPAMPIEDPRFVGDPAPARLFFRARHHHVLLRAREAAAEYQEFLRRYPGHPATDHVLYNLGLLQLSQLGQAETASVTFGQLLERFPRTVWSNEAVYLQARAEAAADHCVAAAALYRRVAAGFGDGREDAQNQLLRLPCS
jgi:hypothetical protein